MNTVLEATRTAVLYLFGLPATTQIILAVSALVLLGYGEYRRRTRTTPTLRARAARALAAAWKTARTPATPDQKDARGDRIELLLVTFFVAVVAGLIMRGLIDFARDSMGLEGVWPYLLFAAFDGAAGLFAFASYRWALKHGASPLFPRLMVAVILLASAWFQWTHATAAGHPLAGQVAWAALPAIGAVLWEFTLRQRMKAWKKAQPKNTEQIPTPRWVLAPVQSAAMKRRMVLWGTASYDEAVDLHVTRVQCMRLLRREFGPLWAWKVPADVAFQLKAGVRITEAAGKVPEIIDTHRREVENRRIVKEAERQARAGVIEPGTYTVSVPDTPAVDLSPVAGVVDVVEPLDAAPAVVEPAPAPWVDPADEWEPEEELDDAFEPFPNEVFPAPFVPTPRDTPADPWADAPDHTEEFVPLDVPTTGTGSVVEPLHTPATEEDTFWDTLTDAGEDVTPAQKTSPAPPDVVGYREAPYDGQDFEDAVNVYLGSVAAVARGEQRKPLSGRGLCKKFRVNPNNRRWVSTVLATAQERVERVEPTTDALF